MKRRRAPNPPQPIANAATSVWERIGRGVLFVHLLVTPLAFSQANVEGFEFVKYLALVLTALLLLVLGALALPRVTRDDLRREFRQPLVLAGLAFVVSALLSTAFSISPCTSLYGHYEDFEGTTTLLSYFVLFLGARWLVRTPEQIRAMFIGVMLAAGLTTIYGILQTFQVDPLHWARHTIIGDYRRPFATFGNSNFLGAYLVLALPPVVWLAAGKSRPVQAVLTLLVAAMLALTVLTLSRGAWLGMTAAACVGAFGWRYAKGGRSLRLPIAGGLLAFVGVALVLALSPQVQARVERFFDSSGRLAIWSCSWRMFADRPLTGWGLDTFPQVFGRYGGVAHWGAFWGESPGRAHNELLHILATQGILGGAAATAGLLALGWTFFRAWALYPERRGLVVAIGASLTGYLITEMFGFVVIACGSLTVVLAAIVSRLGETLEGKRQMEEGEQNETFASTRQLSSTNMLLPRRGCIAKPRVALRAPWVTSLLHLLPRRGCTIAARLLYNPFGVQENRGFIDSQGAQSATLGFAMQPLRGSKPVASSRQSHKIPLTFAFFIFRSALVVGCLFLAVHLVVDPWFADRSSHDGEVTAASRPEEALRLHEKAVRLCPHEPVYWNRLAQQTEAMARATKSLDEKVSFLKRARSGYAMALSLDRQDGLYLDGLGRALGELARLGFTKPQDAYADFDTALRLEPGNAYIYIDASRAAICLGDAERAKKYTDAGLLLYPDRGPLLEQVAMRWLLLNRPLDAIPAFAIAMKGDWRTREADEYRMVDIYREVLRRMEAMKSRAQEGNAAEKTSGAGKDL